MFMSLCSSKSFLDRCTKYNQQKDLVHQMTGLYVLRVTLQFCSVWVVFLLHCSTEETNLLLVLKGKMAASAQGWAKIPAVTQVYSLQLHLKHQCLLVTTDPPFLWNFSRTYSCIFFPLKLKWAFVWSLHMLCILDHPHHRCSSPCIKTGFQLILLKHLTLKGKQIKSLSWGYNVSFSPLWLCIIILYIWLHHQNLTSCICVG